MFFRSIQSIRRKSVGDGRLLGALDRGIKYHSLMKSKERLHRGECMNGIYLMWTPPGCEKVLTRRKTGIRRNDARSCR